MNDGEKLIIRLDTNRYDPQSNLCNILFDTYVVSLKDRRLLDYFSELHVTKVYSISEIRDLLEQCGFEVIGFYEVATGGSQKIEPVGQSTFRVLAVATSSSKNCERN